MTLLPRWRIHCCKRTNRLRCIAVAVNGSKKAAAILSEKGFKVVELGKGFNAWQAAGKEIEY